MERRLSRILHNISLGCQGYYLEKILSRILFGEKVVIHITWREGCQGYNLDRIVKDIIWLEGCKGYYLDRRL